jgi:hypothetical protein
MRTMVNSGQGRGRRDCPRRTRSRGFDSADETNQEDEAKLLGFTAGLGDGSSGGARERLELGFWLEEEIEGEERGNGNWGS